MARVLKRDDFRIYIESANTPDYSSDEWIINPNLSNVGGTYPYDEEITRYWKEDPANPGVIIEMNSTEQEAIDGALLDEFRDRQRDRLKNRYNIYLDRRYEPMHREMLYVRFQNAEASIVAEIQSVFDWMATVMAYYDSKDTELRQAATKVAIRAVSWDFTTFTDTDPNIRIRNLF